ncbi:hypothetical protein CPC08DRAFT_714530 [Agrocybe pediades]|nr:hypothetical protein CPC08DRAFT_714530 [Agrocybe pediades]
MERTTAVNIVSGKIKLGVAEGAPAKGTTSPFLILKEDQRRRKPEDYFPSYAHAESHFLPQGRARVSSHIQLPKPSIPNPWPITANNQSAILTTQLPDTVSSSWWYRLRGLTSVPSSSAPPRSEL